MSGGEAFTTDYHAVAAVVEERLRQNLRVRRNLPAGGRVRVDRQLPFLCVYRAPVDREDAGTRELVTTEAAYLFGSSDPAHFAGLSRLCEAIGAVSREHFGVFLLFEIWSDDGQETFAADVPAFRIVAAEPESIPKLIEALRASLGEIEVHGRRADVSVARSPRVAPPDLEPICLPKSVEQGTVAIGLAVRPVYRDSAAEAVFPLMLQSLRRQLAVAMRKAVFSSSGAGTRVRSKRHRHYESLGPTALTRAARTVDRQLCDVAASFDFLLQVTPVNAEDAWKEFRESGCRRAPLFRYRPLPYHPSVLKRHLFDLRLEDLEDSTIALLCSEKQSELDLQLSALRDLNTDRFHYGSLQLYGGVDDELAALAEALLHRLPADRVPPSEDDGRVAALEVADRAIREIACYQSEMHDFEADVEIRDDVAAGLMVVRDRLHVSRTIALPRHRVVPLLHHEIGTHLLTYFNGRRQPFGLLSAGLAGYEPLQEGLAVLAEYLAGGLTASRLRTLAARVLAVQARIENRPFVEAFQLLRDGHRMPERTSFLTVMRAYRAGGLTKDAIYLSGFRDLLAYLGGGHDIEPLYVGKIGLHQVPYIRELRRRGVLGPPGALPRLWKDPQLRDRIDACRRSSVLDIAEATR